MGSAGRHQPPASGGSADDAHVGKVPSTPTRGERGWGTNRRLPAKKAAASVADYDPDVPYWEQGNFAAVDTELTETALEVTGRIPSDLSGLYVRNGSNPTSLTAPHRFLGDGMVHGVRIEQGRASWYRNRWVDTTLRQQRKDFTGIWTCP